MMSAPQFSRRDILKAGLLALPAAQLLQPGGLGFLSALADTDLYPTPLISESNILRVVTGLRPLRSSGVRLEVEKQSAKTLIHNYGHGGSGFTLAWGSAIEAADLVQTSLPNPGSTIAILGAGVIGLTTAQVLIERGYKVKIYFAKISPDTTSDVAGAQWSPSFISEGKTPAEKQRYHRMLASTYRRYEDLKGEKYGVFLRPNYIPDGHHDGLQDVPAGILKPTEHLAKLPFQKLRKKGQRIDSWLIEPATFLPALISDLRQAGVEFEKRDFKSVSELQSLPETHLVNCCGLGSRELFKDRDMNAMKGQLVLLKPDPRLDYMLLHRGYIFCRRDAIVLGGSYERGVFDLKSSREVTQKILRINREIFGV